MSEETRFSQIYLHALHGSCGAPSGCIGVSDRPHHDDLGAWDSPCALLQIDQYGQALTDAEADAMADEVCRRWNAFPDLLAACKSLITSVIEGTKEGNIYVLSELHLTTDLARAAIAKATGGTP